MDIPHAGCSRFYIRRIVSLLSEGNAASVEAVDDSEALDIVSHLPQAVAAALETFLDDESHACYGRTGLSCEVYHAHGGVAVGEEVIDEDDAVGGGEEVAADAYGVGAVLGEGVDFGNEHVIHRARLFLLDEDHRQLPDVAQHDGGGYAAGLDSDYFVVVCVLKSAAEFAGNLVHQVRVELVVEETVHLEYAARQGASVLKYAFIEQFHGMGCE